MIQGDFHLQNKPTFQVDDRADDINLAALIQILWQGRIWLLVSTLVFVLMGAYYAYIVAKPEFSASATVEFSPEEGALLDLDSIVSGTSTDTDSLNTQLEAIQSREMIELLVAKLDLSENPEFNLSLRPETRSGLLEWIDFRSPPPALSAEQEQALMLRATTEAVSEAIDVGLKPDTYIFKITARSGSPETAANLANALAELYIDQQKVRKFEATKAAIDWLSDRVITLETQLQSRENEIKDLQASSDLISPDALDGLNLRTKEFRLRLKQRELDLSEMEQRLAQLQAIRSSGDIVAIRQEFADTQLNRIAGQMADTDTPAPYETLFFRRADTRLSEEQANVLRTQQEVAALEVSVTELAARLKAQTDDLHKLEQMQRELNVTGDLYQTFLTGLQEATVQVGLVRADTRIMSKALSPLRPIAPKKPVIVVGSAFVGILFCAAILLIQASRNASFTSSHELENFTGYPVWGQIPKVHKRKRQDVVRFITDNPTAAVSEAVRNLRTSVLMSSLDAPPKVIMTTSSLPGEGKTTLAIMLAINLAQMGGKVLLIEADIRRRALDNYYPETDQTFGLVDAITGKIPLSEAIFRDEERSFDVLRGQMSSANPADLFSSNGFKAMIETAREKYDHIIIDTPPVLIVPDARIIAPISDTITFAVAWNRTQKNQVREGLKLIQPSAGVVMGLALSKVDQKQSSNYGSYSYGYSHYGDDYGKS